MVFMPVHCERPLSWLFIFVNIAVLQRLCIYKAPLWSQAQLVKGIAGVHNEIFTVGAEVISRGIIILLNLNISNLIVVITVACADLYLLSDLSIF